MKQRKHYRRNGKKIYKTFNCDAKLLLWRSLARPIDPGSSNSGTGGTPNDPFHKNHHRYLLIVNISHYRELLELKFPS